jgi:hypothetical protein
VHFDDDDLAGSATAVTVGTDAVLAWVAAGNEHPSGGIGIGLLHPDTLRAGTTDDFHAATAAAVGLTNPAIAFSGTSYLVVWQDRRRVDLDGDTVTHTDADVWARLVRSVSDDSTEFGSDETPLAPAPYESSRPTVAWTGDAFLVAWQDYRDGNFEIYAARIPENWGGEPVEARRVTTTAGASKNPSVAWREGEVFLAWQEAATPWEESGAAAFGVRLSRSTDGGVTWEEPLVVVDGAGASPEPKVATSTAGIGVAWLQDVPPDVNVEFVRIECR